MKSCTMSSALKGMPLVSLLTLPASYHAGTSSAPSLVSAFNFLFF
jgi:hypothetical protein